MDLKNLVYGIYGLINYKRTDVFAEYEKIPVKDHDNIYIVTSIENISLKNQFIKSSLKRYETLIDLKVRVLGLPDEDHLFFMITWTTLLSAVLLLADTT